METTYILLCMALAIGLLIGTLILNHQASAQIGMMKPNMMNRTGMIGMLGNMANRTGVMGTTMNPNMMNMNPMMGNMMNPMMGNMMNPMMGNMMNPMMGNMMNPMMNMNPMMGNMMNPMMFTGQNITSSVSLLRSMMNGISSQVKISLGDAVTNAQRELGNTSHAIAANIGEVRGYLIYSILGIDPDMNLQQILIDPGNGRTLLSQKLPMWQIMGTGNMMNPMMGNMMNPMMGNMMNPMMGNMMNPMMGNHDESNDG